MPVDELRPAVQALMDRAKADLAELVSFQSVADPKQYPPEECEKAAQWVVDAFAAVGLQDVTMSPTPDGSNCVHGHAPGPEGSPTVLLYCHYDVQPPLGEDAVDGAGLRAHRARRPLVRPRLGRLQGQHRHAPHGAARAAAGQRRASRAASSSSARARRSRARAASRRSCRDNVELLRADTILVVDTGNFAVGVPTLTTTLRGMTSVDVTLEALGSADALRHVRRPGARSRARPDPDARARCTTSTATRRSTGSTQPQTWTGVDYSAEQFRADANVLDGVELMGDGTPADMLWARPSATVLGIDVPHVIGSSAAIQASAAARVSLRIPHGVGGQDGAGRARRAPAAAACRGACTARSSASRSATRSSARSYGPGYESLKAAMEEAFEHER